MMNNTSIPSAPSHWSNKLAACLAVLLGMLLIFMASGHIKAVIALAQAQNYPDNWHLVSMITIGVILALPGVFGIALSRWLWQGRVWAYTLCIACASIVLLYLIYLLLAVAPNSSSVGSELNFAVLIVTVYIAFLAVIVASSRNRRQLLNHGMS